MGRSLACIIIAFVLLPLASPAQAQALKRQEPRAVDLGAISVTGGGGGRRSLASVLPKGPAIVHLWATWCAPCREELPALADFAGRLDAHGLSDRLVLVSVDRGRYGQIRSFLDGLSLDDLDSWQEAGRSAGTVLGIRGYPTTIVLDADHRVVVRHAGVLPWEDKEAQAWLAAYLASGS